MSAVVVDELTRRLDSAAPDQPEPSEGRELPPRPVYRDMLRRLLDRRVQIFAIFSGALRERYNHADHLYELFPEVRGRIDRAYFPAANHMFTEGAARAALITAATDWIVARQL